MPTFSKEIIEYGNALSTTIEYVQEFNKIVSKIHMFGTIQDIYVTINVSYGKIHSVRNFYENIRMYFIKDVNPKLTIDTDPIDGTGRLRYVALDQSLKFMDEIMYIDYAWNMYDELLFQYSTIYDKSITDMFELAMYLHSIGCNESFALTGVPTLEELKEFNINLNAMVQTYYEKFDKYREVLAK